MNASAKMENGEVWRDRSGAMYLVMPSQTGGLTDTWALMVKLRDSGDLSGSGVERLRHDVYGLTKEINPVFCRNIFAMLGTEEVE